MRTCQWCGKEIPASRRKDAKCCSKTCRGRAAGHRFREKNRTAYRKLCLMCVQPFYTTRRRRLYCCAACRQRAGYERAARKAGRPRDKTPRTCPICSSWFVSVRFNQRYCSKSCLWHSLNAARIARQRKTDREQHISPELIQRRAQAIRARWSKSTERKRQRGSKLLELRECRFCGESFLAARTDRLFCSNLCRGKAQYKSGKGGCQ